MRITTVDRRVILASAVILLLIPILFNTFRGYTHEARFPYDWRYYVDVNIPSYSTDHPVVKLTLPTAVWVKNYHLHPDCSDLRFTTTDSTTFELDYHILFPVGPVYLPFKTRSVTPASADINFSVDYPSYVRIVVHNNPNDTLRVTVYDVNESRTVASLYHYTPRSYYYTGFVEFNAVPRHLYRIHFQGDPVYYENYVDTSRLPSWVHASGSVAGMSLYAFYVRPHMPSTYCADNNVTVLVRIPQNTHALRVWFGAVGDTNFHSVPIYALAREVTPPMSYGSQSFSSCSYQGYYQYSCSGGSSGMWGAFNYSKHFEGYGKDRYCSSMWTCHNKRWCVSGYHRASCTSALANSFVSSHLSIYLSGTQCTTPPPSGASLSISAPSGYVYYALRADRLTVASSCVHCYANVLGSSVAGSTVQISPWTWECYDGSCLGVRPHSYSTGYYGRDRVIYVFEDPVSSTASFSTYYSYDRVCGGVSMSITPYGLRQYYLRSSDIIPLTVPSTVSPISFSTPPSVVFHAPATTYWGVPTKYSIDGNFARAEIIVDNNTTYPSSSVTLEWNVPSVHHVSLIAYNEYNTPTWHNVDVNVLRRTLSLSVIPQSTPYVREDFPVVFTVTDNVGDPVPNALVAVDGCVSCTTASDGTCVSTCRFGNYGLIPADANVIPDVNYYVPLHTTVEFNISRWPTTVKDLSATINHDLNAFYIHGYVYDILHNAPVSAQPVTATIYLPDSNTPMTNAIAYTFPNGEFRFYIRSAVPGTYRLHLAFTPDCNSPYDPTPFQDYTITFSTPSSQPSEQNVESNAVTISTTTVSSPVTVAVPVSITPSTLSVSPLAAQSMIGGAAILGLFFLLVVFLR